MKTVKYTNRYKDEYTFTEISENQVEMTGSFEYMRTAYENDYEPAYAAYKASCDALEEPDYDLLVDMPVENCLRPLTFAEFRKEVHEEYFFKNEVLRKFSFLVKSDMDDIHMIDPSGGPYISKGMDLSSFFGDLTSRIVNEIIVTPSKITFKIIK